MLLEPEDLDHEELRDVVRTAWGVHVDELAFLTVGGDSWGYRAGEVFVNVRESRGQRKAWTRPRDLERVLSVAAGLREHVDFLLTPRPTLASRPLATLGRYAVTVFPYIEGTPGYEREASAEDLRQLASWVRQLHSAPTDVDLVREDFSSDFAGALVAAFDRAPSASGPYAEPLCSLVSEHGDAVRGALRAHIEHGTRLRNTARDFVVTHGEPYGNVLYADDGRRFLIDLGELLLGPRERDLHDIPPDLWEEPGDIDVVNFYKQSFALSEVAEYADRLARDHVGDAEDERAWHELVGYTREAIGRAP